MNKKIVAILLCVASVWMTACGSDASAQDISASEAVTGSVESEESTESTEAAEAEVVEEKEDLEGFSSLYIKEICQRLGITEEQYNHVYSPEEITEIFNGLEVAYVCEHRINEKNTSNIYFTIKNNSQYPIDYRLSQKMKAYLVKGDDKTYMNVRWVDEGVYQVMNLDHNITAINDYTDMMIMFTIEPEYDYGQDYSGCEMSYDFNKEPHIAFASETLKEGDYLVIENGYVDYVSEVSLTKDSENQYTFNVDFTLGVFEDDKPTYKTAEGSVVTVKNGPTKEVGDLDSDEIYVVSRDKAQMTIITGEGFDFSDTSMLPQTFSIIRGKSTYKIDIAYLYDQFKK